MKIRYGKTLDKKICSDFVYRYWCSSWNATYYGKSFWHCKSWAAVHMGISNFIAEHAKESVVSNYLLKCDYTIDFDHFDILAYDTNSFRLLIKESLLVEHDKPVLNRAVESFPLKLFN